jgi:hypothetical protein
VQQPGRTIVGVALALLVLVVATTVLVLLVERRGPPQYPPDSPEAAVMTYIEALRRNDPEQVLASLSSGARRVLEQRERIEPYYDFKAELRGASENLRTARVRIDGVEIRGERAVVTLSIERTGAGLEPGFPFPIVDGGSYSYQRTLVLVREDGTWKIDELAFYL